jgi:hypothetical protein
VFSELPSFPSAGRRSGCFHTSLGHKTSSLIRVSLGWFDYSKKKVRKDNPTPAYSPVSDRRRLTALAEGHWARRVQAPTPQIIESNLQKNHIIETCKEEWCAVSTQEISARRKWESEHLTCLSAPWTLISTKTYSEIPDEWNEQRKRKHTYSQTSRLEKTKKLQIDHNHQKNPVFDCAVALCTMQNAKCMVGYNL